MLREAGYPNPAVVRVGFRRSAAWSLATRSTGKDSEHRDCNFVTYWLLANGKIVVKQAAGHSSGAGYDPGTLGWSWETAAEPILKMIIDEFRRVREEARGQ